jgi:ubiquinone/menaquinone biosynthesis C-methylase UbiE
MSTVRETAARFDKIAEVYDDTREPLSHGAMEKVASILARDGCKHLLEVGVGTGRIAGPLQTLGFDITGVDVSRGMLAKAKRKGLTTLFIADANRLPFKEETFDAAMMAHVLHLLDHPLVTLESLHRVTRKEVVAVTRRRDNDSSSDYRVVLREAFRNAIIDSGYGPDWNGDWRRRFEREAEFIEQNPPTEIVVIQDTFETITLEERLSRIEKRGWLWAATVPESVIHTAIEKVKQSVDLNRTINERRIEQMCIWREPSITDASA